MNNKILILSSYVELILSSDPRLVVIKFVSGTQQERCRAGNLRNIEWEIEEIIQGFTHGDHKWHCLNTYVNK